MSAGSDPSELDLSSSVKRVLFQVEDGREWELLVPRTVYPPREDTLLLARALGTLEKKPGLAVEIGCGSGAISIYLASLGWSVEAYDVNPMAVSSTRGNARSTGLSDFISVREGGLGEHGWNLPKETSLLVWNLPYLDPLEGGEKLEPIEDASMLDIVGGWSDMLLENILESDISDDCLVVLLHRTDPPSQSRSDSWLMAGWARRTLRTLRIGEERLEVIGYWKPAGGIGPLVIEECDSTMDEARRMDESQWSRVLSLNQGTGRGRRGSKWETIDGAFACTWSIPFAESKLIKPGLLQTSIGAAISAAIGCECKWPNDLITEGGVKLGGILIESSTSESILRVGVGVNRDSAAIEEIMVAGWLEFLPEMELMDIFALLDASIASLLESKEDIPEVSESDIVGLSWKGLANSLSKGTRISLGGTLPRIVGMDNSGRLEIEESGNFSIIDEVGRLEWEFY